MKKAYGFIEMLGLASAVVAVDTALKAANVELDGLESAKGAGMHTLKISGEVSSVKAAVSSILGERSLQGKVYAHTVIARPSDGLEAMIEGKDDLVTRNRKETEHKPMPEAARAPEIQETEEAEVEESTSNEEDSEEEDSESQDISEASPDLPQSDAKASLEAKDDLEDEAEMEEPVPQEPGPSSIEGVDAPMEEAPDVEELEAEAKRFKGKGKSVTCNICLDPKCMRLKGEPHAKCIHYKEKE